MNFAESTTIRFAEPGDRIAADVIHRQAFPEDRTYSYANNIGLPGTINLVAVRENQVVGFVSVLVNHSNPQGKYLWERMRPYIGFVGVSEDFRRSGVGRKLIVEASRLALHITNQSCIYLECEIENTIAHRLYEKLGFQTMEPEEIETIFGRPPSTKSFVYRGAKHLFESGETVFNESGSEPE